MIGGRHLMPNVVPMIAPQDGDAVDPQIGRQRLHDGDITERKSATELQRIKKAATPEAVRVSDQPRNSKIGDRKMPPPVPVRPERKPMITPHKTPAQIGGSRGSRFDFNSRGHRSRAPLSRSTTPTSGR